MEHIHLHVHFLSPVHACLHLSSDLSYALHHLPNASALAQACLKKSTHASAVTRVSRLVVNMVAELGADSVYKSHSGSIVETSEDLKAKAESQMAEARRTEVTASHNFKMRQQFLEDELKFNAQDLEATEHSLDEAQGQLTTDTADLKMTEDALARDCQAKAVEFETATNGRSEELDAYAKARAVISQKTGGAESFSYGLTQTSFLQLSRSMLSSRGGLTKFGAVRKIKELAKSEHSLELAQLASRVASAMHAETSTGDVNTHVQHVIDTVEVERPTIIDETVQKPIIQEKINPVTKHVEVSLSQFTDKAMDIPVVAPRQILPMTQTVQKTIEIPQLQCIDEVIDVPAVLVVPVPQVQVSGKTVEISQLQTAEKIVDTFDANGNRVANELRRRDCVMREMRKNKPPFCLALNRADSDEIARHCKYCNERGVTRLYESGTALAEGMRVPVSKMEELIAAHCQTSLKTVKDPDRRPYPAYPSGKSWCEACGKMGSGQKFYHNVTPGSDFAAEAQQQHKSSKHQPTKQAMQQRERKDEKGQGEEERRGEKGREENGRKSEEKRVRKEDEKGDNKVVKDVTGWTVVTRNKRQKKMVQIFVKVNGSKATPMEVNLMDDKVEDVMRQIQKDEDVYVTMHGKVLRRDEKLKSCEVTDGCTVEVTSRMRGGGKHKDKKGKEEKKKQVVQLDDGMCAMACEQMRQVMENLKTLADNSTGEDKRRVVENVEELRKAIIGLRKQARGEELQRVAELEESLKKLEEEMLLWSVEEQEQRRQRGKENKKSNGDKKNKSMRR